VIALLLTAAPTAPLGSPSGLSAALVGFDAAQVNGDRAALDRYLADDYILVNGAAEIENKVQLIADFTGPAFKLNPYRVVKPVARYWHDAAVIAGEVSLRGTSSRRPSATHMRFVDVWRLRSGKWQVDYTQVTRFPSGH